MASDAYLSEQFETMCNEVRFQIARVWTSKIKNSNSINDQDVTAHETTQILKDLTSDLVRNSWNATDFMDEGMKVTRRRDLGNCGRTIA